MVDLERVADEIEIAALITRCARAVDGKDWDLYRSVFTDDAYIDSSYAGAAAGQRVDHIAVECQDLATVHVMFVSPPTTAG